MLKKIKKIKTTHNEKGMLLAAIKMGIVTRRGVNYEGCADVLQLSNQGSKRGYD
jgi:hypothetical protein